METWGVIADILHLHIKNQGFLTLHCMSGSKLLLLNSLYFEQVIGVIIAVLSEL